MKNENAFIYAYQGQTTLHPIAAIALIILIFFLFKLDRKYAVIPFLIMACFISSAQRVVVFGLDFNLIRILVLFGWIRVFIRGETSSFKMQSLDWLIIFWAFVGSIAYTSLRGTSSALIYQLGTSFDAIGLYFLFRCFIHDWIDIERYATVLAYLSIPIAIFFLIEKNTGHNLFSIFGGVPENTVTREGKLRAQGAFSHSIIAGSFWVTQIPIIAMLWWTDKKKLGRTGIICSFIIIISCASSTPLAGFGAILVGWALYSNWHNMRAVWWMFITTLFALHFIMEAPVWHLISRVDIAGGSTGYHRYALVNAAINNFDEWWFLGIESTAHWGWHLFDAANEYVNTGKKGGIFTLLLFIAIISVSFKNIGRLLHNYNNKKSTLHVFSWLLGMSLATHCVVFIGISYFGQIIVVWYFLLAAIASISSKVR